MSLKVQFWEWAHRTTEKLWHWIYYHRIANGIAERKLAESHRQDTYQYTCSFKNSKDVQEWFQEHPGYNDVHKKIIQEIEENPPKPFTGQYQDEE